MERFLRLVVSYLVLHHHERLVFALVVIRRTRVLVHPTLPVAVLAPPLTPRLPTRHAEKSVTKMRARRNALERTRRAE